MENLNIKHTKTINHIGYYNNKISGFDIDNYDEALKELEELKRVILKDIERIYNYKLNDSMKSSDLGEELKYLMKTYLQEKGYGEEFINLTDNYLCFNNIEVTAEDEDIWKAINNNESYVTQIETVVIIPRDFTEFHFLLREHVINPSETRDNLYSYKLADDKVEENTTCFEKLNIDFSKEEEIISLIEFCNEIKNGKQYQKKPRQ